MSLPGTLRYLYGLQHRGMKFGLRNTRTLLAALGHPERAFPSLHIAGTNGKGSTASMLASVLMETGCRTGLYTSPHLIRFSERIRIDGREIPARRVAYYTQLIRPAVEDLRATFFEAVTCIALRHFADEGVDVAVLEAGLGGRLDATNAVMPLACAITSVGLDHTEILGTSLRAIAREKGGIIKPGIPCVTGADQAEVVAQLRRIAGKKGAALYRARDLVRVGHLPGDSRRIRLTTRTLGTLEVTSALPGEHQLRNLTIVAAMCEFLLRLPRPRPVPGRLSRAAFVRGCERVVRNTGLHGRLETFGARKRTILDVAHNTAGMEALVATLLARGERNIVVLFGVMRDKDYRGMLRSLKPITGVLVTVAPRTPRALPEPRLRREARAEGLQVVSGGSVAGGVRRALRLRGSAGPLLVTGSHYVVGEACTALRLP